MKITVNAKGKNIRIPETVADVLKLWHENESIPQANVRAVNPELLPALKSMRKKASNYASLKLDGDFLHNSADIDAAKNKIFAALKDLFRMCGIITHCTEGDADTMLTCVVTIRKSKESGVREFVPVSDGIFYKNVATFLLDRSTAVRHNDAEVVDAARTARLEAKKAAKKAAKAKEKQDAARKATQKETVEMLESAKITAQAQLDELNRLTA